MLGNVRLACCVCFILVIAAARRLFRECAAGVRGDESRPNAQGEKRQSGQLHVDVAFVRGGPLPGG